MSRILPAEGQYWETSIGTGIYVIEVGDKSLWYYNYKLKRVMQMEMGEFFETNTYKDNTHKQPPRAKDHKKWKGQWMLIHTKKKTKE
jgi:hypothetical protein